MIIVGFVCVILLMVDCVVVFVVAYLVFIGKRSSCDVRDEEDRYSNDNEKSDSKESVGY